MDNKISVTFDNEQAQAESRDLSWNGKEQANKDLTDSKKIIERNKAIVDGLVFNLGRQVFMSGLGRYGQYTGDYITQNKINNAFTMVSFIGAFATGNPLAIAGAVIDFGFRIADFNAKVTQSNIEAQGIQDLGGISATARSRGSGSKI